MQNYTYSVFSIVAIVIHLLINLELFAGRGRNFMRGTHYRAYLAGVFVYYMTDAAWGILAELGWIGPWYVDTMLFFIALVVFSLAWCRFVINYLGFGKWMARMLSGAGYALLAVNGVMLTANIFNSCVFHFDGQGHYLLGGQRGMLFALLIAYNILISASVCMRAFGGRDSMRSRSLTILVNCITMTTAITLQVIWPLTPFTSLGCLVGTCFLHVFVIKDEQVARHVAELEKALERARVAERSRSMFFSIVSHDIRTPLNAILGYSELLQHGIMSPAERDEALQSIRASGTTLLQLVNDVLDLAKMDAGKMALLPVPVELAQLTDDVFSSFKLTADGKGIALVNRTADVPTVMLDEHRFRQVLFNLVGNAVKFTPRGAVTVSASYVGSTLEVSVSDTGCGIAPDMLTHVLDPFFQIQDPSHTADRTMGSGLGLSICRRLVELMGGELVITSEPEKGSTFTVQIPGVAINEEKPKPVDEPRPVATLKEPPKHVLVVDDSPVNRSVLKAFLKKMGVVSIDYAGDGEEALAELDSAAKAGHPHDFVFSDLWMPNMNGLELIGRLRADSRFSHLPVFAVTADTESRHDPRTNLFTGILLKPLTYGKLVELVAKTLA